MLLIEFSESWRVCKSHQKALSATSQRTMAESQKIAILAVVAELWKVNLRLSDGQ